MVISLGEAHVIAASLGGDVAEPARRRRWAGCAPREPALPALMPPGAPVANEPSFILTTLTSEFGEDVAWDVTFTALVVRVFGYIGDDHISWGR